MKKRDIILVPFPQADGQTKPRLASSRRPQLRRGRGPKREVVSNSPGRNQGGLKSEGIIVRSLGEYVDAASQFKSNNNLDVILFRGQRESVKPLLPKIGRPETRLKGKNQQDLINVEKRLIDSFQILSLPFLEAIPSSQLEWLAIAQHHGLPTRLLDWTSNALAALWFAIRKEPKKKTNAVVWILNPSDNNFIPSGEKNDIFEFAAPVVYRPRHITKRLIAQSGYFTVHPLDNQTSMFMPFEENPRFRGLLKKIEIRPADFCDLRDNLERNGVSDLTMFPDQEGLCRHITWTHSLLEDEMDPPNVLLNKRT